ncbi:MAG: septum formation initiator family protein [Tannerellaceae bacterium]|jgi:cell division protein FtsB|nr:septum formation initiator family protein [Tannerellaceae bacterium]
MQNNSFIFVERIYPMHRLKEFYGKYLSKVNVYWLVTIGFVALTFTAGDSNLYKRYTYDEKIRSLEKEIKYYKEEIEENTKKLNDLRTDKEGLERFAREEYFMKKPDEDIFIIRKK